MSMTLEDYYKHFVDVTEADVGKSREIVASVLKVLFDTIEERFLRGVKNEPKFDPFIWQGSSTDGLKSVAADEFDVLLPLNLEEYNYCFVPMSVEPARDEVEKDILPAFIREPNTIYGGHFVLLIEERRGYSSGLPRSIKREEYMDFVSDWESGKYDWSDKIQVYRFMQSGVVLSSHLTVQRWLLRMVKGAIEYNSSQINGLLPNVSKVIMKETGGRGPNLNIAIILSDLSSIDVDLVPAIAAKMSRSSFTEDGLPETASSPFKFSQLKDENLKLLEKGWLLAKDKPYKHAWMLTTTIFEKEKLQEIKAIYGETPLKCIKILKTLKLFYYVMTKLYGEQDESLECDEIDLMHKDRNNFASYQWTHHEMEMTTLYSYSIKMCLFHLIDKISSTAEWKPDKLKHRLRDLMIEVKIAHEKGELLNYFCSSINILAKTQQHSETCKENYQLLVHYTIACNTFARKFGMQPPFQ